MWNSLASSLLVTCLIHDERAYKDVMAKAGKIPGLRGRWLAHERRRCARMKAAIAYRRQSCRSSNLSFRAITRQRAAKSGSLKNSIKRTCQSSSGFPMKAPIGECGVARELRAWARP
jgi:hypothetical protein